VSTVPKSVYNTPDPEKEISEVYTIYAEMLVEAKDPKKCWVVREKHGYWDENEQEPKKRFKNSVTTLSPIDPVHYLSIEDAHKVIDQQVLFRANRGFKYLFVWDPYEAPFYKRYEILASGSYQEMP